MKAIPANTVFQVSSDRFAVEVVEEATLMYCASRELNFWTAWEDKLAAQSTNVVTNVPGGLYFKLDKDCLIVEK